MPAYGNTLVFPREDNVFKTKESLSYEEAHSLVWKDRTCVKKVEDFKEWLAHAFVGILVGTVAFLMTLNEGLISDNIFHKMTSMMKDGNQYDIRPWLFYAGTAAICGLAASWLTTYIGPGASMSGLPELVGYLNGVNYPNYISVRSLVVKVVGVTLAVSGKLVVGKEGPLAHIGAVCGVLVLYIPGCGFEFLRNDESKRCFIAAGASAGVSCAFGAPIGGALFAYEMSKPNTFWRFEMIWKVFISCSMAIFTLGLLTSIATGEHIVWGSSILKFDTTEDS
jgi:chloride channel 7